MIGKHLKEYKKKYLKERNAEPRRARIKKNSDWKKRWMPFIKYDHDFDGAFFFDLIMHKLNILYDYYDFGYYTWQSDESKKEILSSLKEIIELGNKIQTFDYYDEGHNFSENHITSYVLIYKHTNTRVTGKGKYKIQLYDNEELIYKMPVIKNDENDILGCKAAHKWVEDNGYDPKKVNFAYTAEWDDLKNHDKWLEMFDEAGKKEQDDIDKFFSLIAKNYRKWWD